MNVHQLGVDAIKRISDVVNSPDSVKYVKDMSKDNKEEDEPHPF